MTGAQQIAIGAGLEKTRLPMSQTRHAPGYIYSSAEILELEKERIFLKDWLCLARVEEVENPGDYMTFRVLNEPVLLSRDERGELHVSANVCRHRGVEIATGRGNTREFTCPYHAWIYDLSGKLKSFPYMKQAESFDFSNCRLKPIRSDTWAGWIFITFNSDAPPLSEAVADFEDVFGFLRQEDLRLADKLEVILECNWKLAVENLLDIYHGTVLHANTFGKYVSRDSYKLDFRKNGVLTSFYSAAPITPDGKTRFKKMPAIADRGDDFACLGHMPPNFNMLARADYVKPWVTWPLGPDKTRLIAYTLFPREAFSDPNFKEKVAIYRQSVIDFLKEDETMISSLQHAMGSTNFEPGPMSAFERPIHHVLNNHLQRLFG
jgi:choline monooxygenase